MTYDQAQSPRLGQRAPVESTSVQMFDVDPSTPTADLVEASWHGQLIYRTDTQGLQIYDEELAAWHDIIGGSSSGLGTVTFVGPPTPTSQAIGDLWFDSDDGYHEYRANKVGADATGGWDSVQDDQIPQNDSNIQANDGKIDNTNTTLSQVAVVAQVAYLYATTVVSFSDVAPDPDLTIDYDDGSIWFVVADSTITAVYQRVDGGWFGRFFGAATLTGLPTSSLSGTVGGGQIAPNSLTPDRDLVVPVVASEALLQGDLVNIWNNNGTPNVRKANANPAQPAHGYVLDAVASGVLVNVYHGGFNPYCANLVPGTQFLSKTAGKPTNVPPTGTSTMVQRVGFAPDSQTLDFQPTTQVLIV